MSRRVITSTAVSLLLALTPATAFAGGAGDEQYQDPLAAPTAPKQPKKTTTTTAPATTTTPSATTAPATTSAPASTAPAQSTSPGSAELPRTGAPAGLIGLGGAALIASGAALRRRSAAQ
jgi:LPXTG-motif cell wall-anchored protein